MSIISSLTDGWIRFQTATEVFGELRSPTSRCKRGCHFAGFGSFFSVLLLVLVLSLHLLLSLLLSLLLLFSLPSSLQLLLSCSRLPVGTRGIRFRKGEPKSGADLDVHPAVADICPRSVCLDDDSE
ncbi:hypothetical protein MHU86_18336 [Fragilaria crotonensis]|nr:hypothetical protein MHU86_18336 [Fragilaria crotonensis]